jgi:hypothetical protein
VAAVPTSKSLHIPSRPFAGHVFDAAVWQQKMRKLCLGDTTFAEAFQRSGRIISINVRQ